MTSKGKKTTQENRPLTAKEEQRRLRNRLSQKAIRERRTARIQHLEQQLASTRQNGDTSRIDQLIEENARLRESLHSTRKKLLSISTTASHVADGIKPILLLDDSNDTKLITEDPQDSSPDSELDDPITTRRNGVKSGSADLGSAQPQSMDHSFMGVGNTPAAYDPISVQASNTSESLPVRSDLNPGLWSNDRASQSSSNSVTECVGWNAEGSVEPPDTTNSHSNLPFNGNIYGPESCLSDPSKTNIYMNQLPGPYGIVPQRVFTGSHFSDHLDYISNTLRISEITNAYETYGHHGNVHGQR